MANQGSDSSSLPSHLVRAEYLEATRSQYIDLGYPLGYNHKVVVDVWGDNHTSVAFTFGNTRVATARIGGDIGNRNGNHYFGNQTFEKNIYKNKRMNIAYSKDGVGVDDVLYSWSATPTDFTTDGNVFLCALNTSSGANYYFKGKIYSCQIYEHDTLIHDYIPAFNTENRRPCMYDTITGIELYNQGTGEFNYHIEGKPIPYLAFEALEDDLQVSITKSATQYSLDRVNWIDLPAEEMTPPISKGEKVWFRAEITPDGTSTGIGTFSCTKQCNLEGTPMSLLYGDRAGDVLSLPNKLYCFAYLFAYNDKIIRVNNPMEFLPAMTLYSYGYCAMFRSCLLLENAVFLPSKILSTYSYVSMYSECISITDTYDFPIWTSLGGQCCDYMFYRCISLKRQPRMWSTADATYVNFREMFSNCSELEDCQEEFRFAKIGFQTFNGIFANTKIKKAPDILATSYNSTGNSPFAFYCDGCKELEIPAYINIAPSVSGFYQYAYRDCLKLKKSPVIYDGQYSTSHQGMFTDCISLNYVICLFTDPPMSATNSTSNWMSGVSKKGTIVLNKNIEWNPEDYRGVNGIPVGWEVKYCDPDNLDDIRDYREIDQPWENLNNE